ncbi:hypothetical protein J1N09_09100 [Aureitalea sp. L0-47]|uniref:porin family protein n=1 Tax=Aureitalea sp. L0-47 TaxID=2816962 RepID=UPI002237D863|nr:porin family protein [Aureitalea sp. L0-47]MCW5519993.1 hypothetical protein [Aureitalea sp. L0-47]
MKEKKQIDKLFQERFQNFEATPPPDAWANIEAELRKEKKDRKVIPLWWKVGGVAALLALLLTISNSVFDWGSDNTQITEEDKIENTTDLENMDKDTILTEKAIEDTDVASDTEETDELENVENDQKVYTNNESKDAIIKTDKSVESAVTSEDPDSKLKKKSEIKDPIIRDKKIITDPVVRDAVAKENSEEKKTEVEKKDLLKKDPKEIIDRKVVETEKVATEEVNKKELETNPLIKKGAQIKDAKIEEAVAKEEADEVKEAAEEEKKSIFDAIEENKEVEEAVAKEESPGDRWEVSPNVGPVYYSSFGNGSSIDPTFADNSQSGDVNFSYGADVSYAISDRLSLRTGIHNVNLSYSTGDIELGTGPVSAALRSIDYGNTGGEVLTAVDKGTIRPAPEGGFGDIRPKSTGAEAFINQSIRYYEVPMELKYALVDNKFGIHMIGGFSTLFLGDNEIAVEAGDFSSVLGEANNLNSLSFTTNVGLGFDYKISRRLKFNIEPIFKYQLNPYSDSTVDFNPFFMGVYTGLSFKF